jgi:hypothetical protein
MAIDDGYTSLLMHFDGVGAVFTEESGKTLTYNGNVVQTVAQSVFGGKSVYFDGAGDYIASGSTTYTDLVFGTNNFTIDVWIYLISGPVSDTQHRTIASYYASSTNYWRMGVYNNAGTMEWNFTVNSSGVTILVNADVDGAVAGRWIHVALTREGNDFKFYQDGIQVDATVTDNSSVQAITGYFRIGAFDASVGYWYGYIDELRISNICRWSANFTVPSLAYAPAPVDDSYTKLLLHFNGPDTSTNFLDQSAIHTVVPYSTAHINTAEKYFGVSSAHVAGQSIDCGIHADWIIADQDFSADCWIRSATLPTNGTYQKIFSHNYANAADWTGIQIRNASGVYYLEYIHYVGSALINLSAVITIATNEWHHCAITKSEQDFYLFFDGVLVATTNTAQSITGLNASAKLYISGQTNVYTWTGWIDEFRWSVGIARWTADFSGSLPTTPYPGTISFSESISVDGLLGTESNNIDFDFLSLTAGLYLSVNSGANITLYLPDPECSIDGFGEEIISIAAVLPHVLTSDLIGSGYFIAELPYPDISFNVLPGNIINFTAILEQITPNIQVSSEILGWVDSTIPPLAVALSGSGEIIGRIAGNLPILYFANITFSGQKGSLALDFPSLFFDSVLLHQGVLVINAEIPFITIDVSGNIENAFIDYKTIVLNTKNNGVTEYFDCDYQKIVNFNQQIIAVRNNTIVSIGPSLDNHYFIPMSFSTGTLGFNEPTVLFPKDIWVTLRSGKKIQLTIKSNEGPDGTEYFYHSENFIPELRKTRIKLGRGFRNSFYSLIIQNIDGELLDIENIKIDSEVISTRHQ